MSAYMKKLDDLNAGGRIRTHHACCKIFNAPIIGFKKLYSSIVEYRDMVYMYSMSCRVPWLSNGL